MNNRFNLSSIQESLQQFEAISLDQLNQRASLLHRRDRKYIFPIAKLAQVIEACAAHYHILEVNGSRCVPFQTFYYDTPTLQCYYDHHRGRSPRHKIRHRIYGTGQEHSLEVKVKTAGFKTKKYRMHLSEDNNKPLQLLAYLDFFDTCNISNIEQYEKILEVRYHRITLVNKLIQEKVTIDLGVSFRSDDFIHPYDSIVIAEIKSENLSNSHFSQLMRRLKISEGGISKYCLGMISLYPNIKFNNFKPIFRSIQKLKSHDIDTGASNTA